MRVLIVIVLALMPGFALAHTGYELTGFTSGLVHPLLGWDHLLAFFCAGVWLLRASLQQAVSFTGLFLLALLAGAGLGLAGWQPPLVEQWVLLSVILLGALLAWQGNFAARPVAGLIAVFFCLHGILHGAEMPLGTDVALYMTGFITASATLFGIGFWMARFVPLVWVRLLGTGVVATGVLASLV